MLVLVCVCVVRCSSSLTPWLRNQGVNELESTPPTGVHHPICTGVPADKGRGAKEVLTVDLSAHLVFGYIYMISDILPTTKCAVAHNDYGRTRFV